VIKNKEYIGYIVYYIIKFILYKPDIFVIIILYYISHSIDILYIYIHNVLIAILHAVNKIGNLNTAAIIAVLYIIISIIIYN